MSAEIPVPVSPTPLSPTPDDQIDELPSRKTSFVDTRARRGSLKAFNDAKDQIWVRRLTRNDSFHKLQQLFEKARKDLESKTDSVARDVLHSFFQGWDSEEKEPAQWKSNLSLQTFTLILSNEQIETLTKQFDELYKTVAQNPAQHAWNNGNILEKLALLIVCDQFSRIFYVGKKEAFALDDFAQQLATSLLNHVKDGKELKVIEKVMILITFLRSEDYEKLKQAQKLLEDLHKQNPKSYEGKVVGVFAEAAEQQANVLQRFGRFPLRNDALGREHTPEEAAFLKEQDTAK